MSLRSRVQALLRLVGMPEIPNLGQRAGILGGGIAIMLAALWVAPLIRAALLPAYIGHILSPDEQRMDHSAPEPVRIVETRIRRGAPSSPQGHETAASGQYATIGLRLSGARDNRTAESQMGYLVRYSEGLMPAGLFLPSGAIRATDGWIWLRWIDEVQEPLASFDFVLTLNTVDLAGNQSLPSAPVHLQDGGGSGPTEARREVFHGPSLNETPQIGPHTLDRLPGIPTHRITPL